MTAFQPEPIGQDERYETLTRLRQARDAGTLGPNDYLQRAQAAVSTQSRDELAALTVGIDTPMFEVYPHQGVSTVHDSDPVPGYTAAPAGYVAYPDQTGQPVTPSRKHVRSPASAAVGMIATIMVVMLMVRTGAWWLVFLIPMFAGVLRKTFKL